MILGARSNPGGTKSFESVNAPVDRHAHRHAQTNIGAAQRVLILTTAATRCPGRER